MIWRTLVFFAALLAVGVGVDYLAQTPGELTMVWFGWEITTTASFAMVMLGILMVLIVILTRVYSWLDDVPRRLRQSYKAKNQQQGFEAFASTMQSLAIGDQKQALKYAKRAQKLLPQLPLAEALLAETMAQEPDSKLAIPHYARLLDSPQTSSIGLRGLLTFALSDGDSERALTYAEEFYQKNPSSVWILEVLTNIYSRQHQFDKALGYVEKWHKITTRKGTAEQKKQTEFMLACIRWQYAQELVTTEQRDKAIPLLVKWVKEQPQYIILSLLLVNAYIQDDKQDKALKTLVKTYKVTPNRDIAIMWLDLMGNAREDILLKKADAMLAPWQDTMPSLIFKAKVAIKARAWVEARKNLEKALLIGEDRTLFQTFAELENTQQHNSPNAARWLRRALVAPDRQQDYDGFKTECEQWRRSLQEATVVDTSFNIPKNNILRLPAY